MNLYLFTDSSGMQQLYGRGREIPQTMGNLMTTYILKVMASLTDLPVNALSYVYGLPSPPFRTHVNDMSVVLLVMTCICIMQLVKVFFTL